MKIGIMGGTFDPIHNGHLYIANEALKQLKLDEVWWLVNGTPPHKGLNVSSRVSRYRLCSLALKNLNGMRIENLETAKAGASYTWESLKQLSEKYPQHRFFFIMGEDSLFSFTSWVHPERIASYANLAVAVRHDPKSNEKDALNRVKKEIKKITERFDASFSLLHTRNVPISSTDLRLAVRTNKNIRDFVPRVVEDYIKEHELYRDDENLSDVENLIPILQKKLPAKRFWHTIGVMETAGALALAHDYPLQRARLAGLLHDCAKCYSNKQLLGMCKKFLLPVTDAEYNSPHLLHGKVGAYMAENDYKVSNKKILHAIAVHTTGETGMNLLDSIVFTADYIEPGRVKADRLAEIRQVAFEDLNIAVLMILEDTISYLERRGAPMDQKTIDTYRWFKNKQENS